MATSKSTLERFLEKISHEPFSGCWLWMGHIAANGYGRFKIGVNTQPVHRISYEIKNGKVPNGMELDHLCRNRSCCNPDHLEAVTHQVNMSRGLHAMKTHCPKGHPYTEGNFYRRRPELGGSRVCIPCQKIYNNRGKRQR